MKTIVKTQDFKQTTGGGEYDIITPTDLVLVKKICELDFFICVPVIYFLVCLLKNALFILTI